MSAPSDTTVSTPPPTAVVTAVTASVKEVLDRLLAKQRQRAQAYAMFDKGFRHYVACKGRDDGAYKSMCGTVTTQFAAISTEVRALADELRALSSSSSSSSSQSPAQVQAASVATQIGELQRLEKEKLDATVQIQLLKATYEVVQDAKFDETYLAQRRDVVATLGRVTTAINEVLESLRYVRYDDEDDDTC